jgi:hypothetical protein
MPADAGGAEIPLASSREVSSPHAKAGRRERGALCTACRRLRWAPGALCTACKHLPAHAERANGVEASGDAGGEVIHVIHPSVMERRSAASGSAAIAARVNMMSFSASSNVTSSGILRGIGVSFERAHATARRTARGGMLR